MEVGPGHRLGGLVDDVTESPPPTARWGSRLTVRFTSPSGFLQGWKGELPVGDGADGNEGLSLL